MLFRALKQSSGELPIRVLDESAITRALMMLRRKQTHQQYRRDRITEERRQLRTRTLLRRRTPWPQARSPGGHVAAIFLVLFAVRTDQGRLFVPVDK
jgi:hypothetical protein